MNEGVGLFLIYLSLKNRLNRYHRVIIIIFFIIGFVGCGEDNSTDLPQIFSITPDDGSINIQLNTNIVVTFDRQMDATTINNTSFTLSNNIGNINGVVSYNTSTFTAILDPDNNLEPETTYTVTLTKDIKDTDRNPLIREYTWTFTTGASLPLDDIPPAFDGATSATATESNSINLTWSPATDNITPEGEIVYLIYLTAIAGSEDYTSPAYTTAPGVSSFVVTELNPNTKYYFVVRARDRSGNLSQIIKEVDATTNP